MIGAAMLFLSLKVDDWFGDGETRKPEILRLTAVFFLLWVLTATQDIAVDGWSLTMLQRKNVGYAGTINGVGQSCGALLGFVVFLTLESKDFCNKYIFSEPRDEGLVQLSEFLQFWGVVFLAVTIFIAIFKRESSEADEELKAHPDFGITKAYPILFRIVKLKPMLLICFFLMSADIAFTTIDVITNMKLIDYGIPKDKIALFNIPSFVVQLTLPIAISKYTAGKYPMRFFIYAFPVRVFIAAVMAVFVYFTPMMLEGKLDDIPNSYYAGFMAIIFFYMITRYSMNTAEMVFFAKIADPLVGGTYMTLMNVSFVGSRLFRSFSTWFVDVITWRSCIYNENDFNATISTTENNCANDIKIAQCRDSGGHCEIYIDGYYLEVAMNICYGILWFWWGKQTIDYLQKLPVSDFHVLSKRPKLEEVPLTEESK